MKQIDCDVIQDLLPSYIDKISSDATNKLIEEHLKTCKKCSNTLNNMNKEIANGIIDNQDEKINYLKKHKKNKIKAIIFTFILTIDIILGIFIALVICNSVEFFVDVNDVNVEYMFKLEEGETEELRFYLYSEKYKNHSLVDEKYEKIDDDGNKEIYLKIAVKGLTDFSLLENDISGTNELIKLDDTVKKIYIEDKKGNSKEIWNKDMKVMSADEWKHWYIDSYAPQEIIEKNGLTYNTDIHWHSWYDAFLWRHLYNPSKQA